MARIDRALVATLAVVVVVVLASPTLVSIRNTTSEAVVIELETRTGTTQCDLDPGETGWDVWLASWRDQGSNPLVVWSFAGGAREDGGLPYRVPARPIGAYRVLCADEPSGRGCGPEP